MSFGYDPEAVIQEADIEMADLRRAAAEHGAVQRRVRRLRVAGKLDEAARQCEHKSGGWPADGDRGEWMCGDCGSRVDRDPFCDCVNKCDGEWCEECYDTGLRSVKVVVPCEVEV